MADAGHGPADDGPAGARRRDRARLAGRGRHRRSFEVHTPLLEGYAGIFFEGENRIEISEDLDDLTIIHEASHAWFNGDLFVGRWINEGFADSTPRGRSTRSSARRARARIR